MAVGLAYPSDIRAVAGIRIGTTNANIRHAQGSDVAIFEIAEGANIAGVFTRNVAQAAPVSVAKKRLLVMEKDTRSALIVNSGNANAAMGQLGINDCLDVCSAVAESLEIEDKSVLPFSTGVIGERLPVDKLVDNIPQCVTALKENGWLDAAKAIMTTDTVPKAVTMQTQLAKGTKIMATGIAKGSGMIYPNMATMLAFIATDADVEREYLHQCLIQAVDLSFNRITVDGDTSTNDSCVLIATGASGVEINANSPLAIQDAFTGLLSDIACHLAKAIVRDGEGATKFVEIKVSGAANDIDCLQVAMTVAHSPLVKTAFAASDPNWGRIYAAVGRCGIDNLKLSELRIAIDDIEVMAQGRLSSEYSEREALEVMQKEEFSINIDLGLGGSCSQTVWTSDLSSEYVRINAEYRT